MSTTVLETTRTMPNRRASTRFSTYSTAPTLAPSVAPSRLSIAHSDPKRSLDYTSYASEYTRPVSEYNRPGNRASYAGPALCTAFPTTEVDEGSLKSLQAHLQRMEDARLQNQRFVISSNKQEELMCLSLGAKLEKALARRMSGQDAVFTPKKKKAVLSEKQQ